MAYKYARSAINKELGLGLVHIVAWWEDLRRPWSLEPGNLLLGVTCLSERYRALAQPCEGPPTCLWCVSAVEVH